MAPDTLGNGRRTRGSHTVLIHGLRMMNRAGVLPQTFVVSVMFPYSHEEVEPIAPVQSVGESQPSLRIENYLRSALAGFSELVSETPRRIRMTASPEARAAQMDPWDAKNGRRIRLIQKKHREGLNEKETAELERLKREVSAHIQRKAPRSTEVIDEFATYVQKLKEKVASKKAKKQ